ncbi:MAG: HAMP domain-containing sensor histidine kinase [Planctomycetota bacterium]|nr:HAMP domain-containing sensor histidine kinase [Planctomycetota bacterium]
MSLRTRLTLVFGALIGLLVMAEWALVTALTRDLEQEVAEVAFRTGAQVLGSVFPEVDEEEASEGSWLADDHGHVHSHLRAFVVGGQVPADLHSVLGPLHEKLLQQGELVLHQEQVMRREEADARPTLRGERRLRLPDHLAGANAGHVIVLTMDTEDELSTVATRGFGLRGPIGSLKIRVQASRLGSAGGARAIALGVGVEDVDIEVLRMPEAIEIEHELSSLPPDSAAKLLFEKLGQSPNSSTWTLGGPPLPHGATARPRSAPTLTDDETSALPAAAAADDVPLSVEIPISSAGIDQANRTWLRRLMLGTGGILALGLLVAGWLAHRVTRPLRDLSKAAREVGEGALGTQAPASGDREVGEAIGAFNQMSSRLAQLDAEATGLRQREHLTEIGEMARGLAHAMRNPLHLLGLSVEQLAAKGDDSSRDLAESARGQIGRIDRSLRSFLALSSGGAGVAEAVRVDDLARDVALEVVQQGAGGARVEVAGDDRCSVQAVAAELRAVLHVLVVNAVEASHGGETVHVVIACRDRGVSLEVLDRGPGLADEVRDKLFTPHLTTKEQGAGMGLFLAHRIATSRYAGTLDLFDREGGGTRAVLTVHDREGSRG